MHGMDVITCMDPLDQLVEYDNVDCRSMFCKISPRDKNPGLQTPIIPTMDASLPVLVCFKHSPLWKNHTYAVPAQCFPKIVSPATARLVDLQLVC